MHDTKSTPEYDHLLKILLIGDSGVGKSSLLNRFCDDSFTEKQLTTIGVDFKVKYVEVKDRKFKLAIWDTAGQERFRTLTSSYYRGAHALILVYDTSDRKTFENLTYWLEEVKKYSTNADALIMIVGNKLDASREVSTAQGQECAFNNSAIFIETSAKTRTGVREAFEELLLKITENQNLMDDSSTMPRRSVDLTSSPGQHNCNC